MAKIVKEEETVGFGTNGTGEDAGAEAHPPASAAKVFSREAFQAMQEDRDLSPSLATDEEDETHVSLGRPGKNFFTIHPSPEYELIWPVTYDVRTSGKADPFLVAREHWGKFPGALLRIKRLLLCLKFEDESLRAFVWCADWHESRESPNELHKSLGRVIAKGRGAWGQALFENGVYAWRHWPETWMGEPPPALWPDRDFYDIVTAVFADRFIATPDHDLIRCIGRE